jgi:citrate lyase subunit beta/citryl-CoA lyase
MSKPYPGRWVIRTLLFTAGHIEKYMNKSLVSGADCVVLDLEDAVPISLKETAREMIVNFVKNIEEKRVPIMIRVNPMDTGLTLIDLDAVACKEIDGFIYPKAYSADDVKAFDAQLTLKEQTLGLENGHFDIIALIETPSAVLNVYEIATSSPRIIGLLFGSEDYIADMEGYHGPRGRDILCPRNLVVLAARAAGIVPIDTPYVHVRDDDGLREHITQARELGFNGMLVMSPRQIQIARELYTPSLDEVNKARELVQLAAEAQQENRGIAMSGGVFISPPTLKRAKNLLSKMDAIRSFEEFTGI